MSLTRTVNATTVPTSSTSVYTSTVQAPLTVDLGSSTVSTSSLHIADNDENNLNTILSLPSFLQDINPPEVNVVVSSQNKDYLCPVFNPQLVLNFPSNGHLVHSDIYSIFIHTSMYFICILFYKFLSQSSCF